MSNVVPIFTLAAQGFDRSRGVVRIAARRIRPDRYQVFRSFPPWLGLVCAVDPSTAPATGSSDFTGSKSCCRRKEFRPGRPPPRPPAARAGDRSSIVSFCASGQDLVRDAELGLELDCRQPLEWFAMRCAAQNHTSAATWTGASPSAVIDVWRPRQGIRRCAPALQQRCPCAATGGADKPYGQRRSNKNAAQLVSSKARLKLAQRSRLAPMSLRPTLSPAHGTSYYILTWDSGMSPPGSSMP